MRRKRGSGGRGNYNQVILYEERIYFEYEGKSEYVL